MIESEADFYEKLANYVAARSEQMQQSRGWGPKAVEMVPQIGPAYLSILIATGEFLVKEREVSMEDPDFSEQWLDRSLFRALHAAQDVVFERIKARGAKS